MTRAELIADLREARARMDSALGPLDEARLSEPGPGGWRLRDILSHLTAWEVDLLTNLGQARRGQKPGKTQWRADEIQAQNERWQLEFKDRPPAAVLADFRGVHQQLLRQAEAFEDVELNAPVQWLQGRSLETYFRGHAVNHEREHAAELVAWQAQAGR